MRFFRESCCGAEIPHRDSRVDKQFIFRREDCVIFFKKRSLTANPKIERNGPRELLDVGSAINGIGRMGD